MPYAFDYDGSTNPPTLLPTWLDTEGLWDVTQIQHRFRVFFDPKTGHTHDGETYYEEAKKYGLIN